MKNKMIRAVTLTVIGGILSTSTVLANPITETNTKVFSQQDKIEIVKEIQEGTEIENIINENETFILTEDGYIDKSDLYEKMYVTAESGLNLRPEPNTDCERIKAVPYNTELKIKKESIKEDTDWYIGYDEDIEFYVFKEYLSYENQNDDTALVSGDYLGNFKLTAYCACSKCCGKWASYGLTASGTKPVQGRTVAMSGVPFGTKLLINGNVYTVEDRGTPYGHVDIYFNSHNEALRFGVQYADVYLTS